MPGWSRVATDQVRRSTMVSLARARSSSFFNGTVPRKAGSRTRRWAEASGSRVTSYIRQVRYRRGAENVTNFFGAVDPTNERSGNGRVRGRNRAAVERGGVEVDEARECALSMAGSRSVIYG